ncbi:uncharacterized protein BO72DRAFT_453261 [Aspergillus fijiensis CBS 313.89]|uniref:Uncharacterized protein n=1 Tax=Aspergillus fijiensis CBS 313.89 TaxID=1448319 RepID=A0A8G1REP6_9EURO|nr:uncharacterized protein BO72DRAFT_453261 [Aspergillus fijiensis CBS 313.89]RAK71889.1 hypothetical protein BO72DRAFT_453261 [Aspergillus fijiensis CBS 313.89]
MDSTSNSHAAGPALPTLAHNLLLSDEASSSCQQSVDDIDSSHPPHQTESWNLYADINAGLQASPESAFRAGSVIGFSRLRSENNENTEDDECLSQLPRALLTAHLVRQAQTLNAPNSTAVYIVHPATFNPFSPRRLLASLLNTTTTTTTNRQVLTRDAAIACLDRVQLFPVFDLQAALQAIHEISSAVASSAAGRNSLQPNKAIVLVAGLDTLAEGVVRTSNAARGAAALTAALRTLTHLTRTGPAAVSVLLVNTSGLGTAAANADYASGSIAMQDEASSLESGVRSAFGANGASLFPSLLMRTLDQGLDTHILVSTIKGSGVVVEVIKDRLGEGIGKWCVWKSI